MGDLGETRKITRSIEWKLNLADLIMQVDELPEDALRMFVKMQYSKMHEGAAAENFQQINAEEAVSQFGGDAREALKRYLKPWFLLNIPLESGSIGPVPPDAPPIVQRVWKNLEKLLLHPMDDEIRMAQEVQKRTDAFETATRKYKESLTGALKTFDKLATPKREWADKLQEAYTNLVRAEKDIEDLTKEYDAEKSGREQAEKRIETQNKQIEGIRKESERVMGVEKNKYAKLTEDNEGKKSLIDDLSAEVESTKTANDTLGNRVVSLEGELTKKEGELTKKEGELAQKTEEVESARKANDDLAAKVQPLEEELGSTKQKLAKETDDSTTYQTQSIKVQKSYDDKEKELVQEREITKTERGKADVARAKADKLENKLNNINRKWVIKISVGAALLAAGLFFYRPSGQVAPVENVPQEVINYSKDRITVKFGSVLYDMNADRFSEIYQDIQKDQQKSGRQFTPADRKQYFEKKVDSARQIK